jgi:nucleoside-diphosphate-sugar epimerase
VKALVTGAGGFIGGHLVKRLIEEGQLVRAVDRKPLHSWQQIHPGAENWRRDLSLDADCRSAVEGVEYVYQLACDMGGIGHIERFRADCALSVLISSHMFLASRDAGVKRIFYSSSACVYRADKQTDPNVTALKEADAWPASPEAGYGLEKLFIEQLAILMREDHGLDSRIARYHNVFGTAGEFEGGREKAPAAICRKVIEAKLSGRHEIEIWGDGSATRSFMWIDDCVEGTRRLMDSDFHDPINVGSSELVTINQLVDIVEEIAGVKLKRVYDLSAPQGVRGRNSDNTLIKQVLGWEPTTPLMVGLERTYAWIYDQIVAGRSRH